MARAAGTSVDEVLDALQKAGQSTLPGGGAEILSGRAREIVSRNKGGPEAWLDVHRAAHKKGWRSTATMMFGHVEGPEEIVEHWTQVRALQDETGGFTAFIPGVTNRATAPFFPPGPTAPAPFPICVSWRRRGFTWTTSPTSRPPGSRKGRNGTGRPPLRRRRFRRHPDRGARPRRGRFHQHGLHGGGRLPHPGGRICPRPADNALRNR